MQACVDDDLRCVTGGDLRRALISDQLQWVPLSEDDDGGEEEEDSDDYSVIDEEEKEEEDSDNEEKIGDDDDEGSDQEEGDSEKEEEDMREASVILSEILKPEWVASELVPMPPLLAGASLADDPGF